MVKFSRVFILLVVSQLICWAPVQLFAGPEQIFETAARYAEINGWNFRYTPAREALHQQIVGKRLLGGTSSQHPTIIFTAGPFGAGKSVVMGALMRSKILNPDTFLWIDPDAIKEDIPEYHEFQKIDPENAATAVHRESGHIQESLLEAALKLNKSIIVDGSLSAKEWWKTEFARIRKAYPEYALSIVYVSAGQETILQRVEDRGKKTGRFIPRETVIERQKSVVDSVSELKRLTDMTVEISNDLIPRVVSYFKNGIGVDVKLEMPLEENPNIFSENGDGLKEVPASLAPGSVDQVFNKQGQNIVQYKQLLQIARGQKVVVLDGYTDLGFENNAAVMAHLNKLVRRVGDNSIYVLSGLDEGIGQASSWIPKLASQAGLKNIRTAAIVDARSEHSSSKGHADYVVLVDEKASLPVASHLRVQFAKTTGGQMVVFKGDKGVALEVTTALENGVPVTLIRDNRIKPIPERVATKLISEPGFEEDPTAQLATNKAKLGPRFSIVNTTPTEAINSYNIENGIRSQVVNFEGSGNAETVKFIVNLFPEVLLLASDDVDGTPEAVKTASKGPLAVVGTPLAIDGKKFSEQMRWLTDAKPPQTIDSPKDGLEKSFSETLFGHSFIEFDRTVTTVLCLKWILEGNYDQFTASQAPGKKLTRSDFGQMEKFVRSVIRTPEDRNALVSLLIINNLGKSAKVRKYLKEHTGIAETNFQKTLAETLKKYPNMSPSFDRLSPARQSLVRDSLETDFNLGQYIQSENVPANLTELQQKSRESLNFYFVVSLVKIAGAAGHVKREGSIVMDQPTFSGWKTAVSSLSLLTQGHSPSVAYDYFLQNRGEAIGLKYDANNPHGNRENQIQRAAVRISLLLRYNQAAQTAIVVEAIKKLPHNELEALVSELNYDGISRGAFLLYYAPATLANLRETLKTKYSITDEAVFLHLGVEVLAKTFMAARQTTGSQPGVTQIRMNDVAKAVTSELESLSSWNIHIAHGEQGFEATVKKPTEFTMHPAFSCNEALSQLGKPKVPGGN